MTAVGHCQRVLTSIVGRGVDLGGLEIVGVDTHEGVIGADYSKEEMDRVEWKDHGTGDKRWRDEKTR